MAAAGDVVHPCVVETVGSFDESLRTGEDYDFWLRVSRQFRAAEFDRTLAYMGERHAFGQRLSDFQALQFRLAEIETRLQAARVYLRQAAWKLDQGHADATRHCAMAKLHVTDAAFEVANQCLQLHGGYGYLADYGIEKIVRDLRVHQILEGTNEIMRVIIARALLAEPAP